MRTVEDITMFPDNDKKFHSPKGDTTFTIAHGKMLLVVDAKGNVISPSGGALEYNHEDFMKGNQSGIVAKVKDFLTVTTDMDTFQSIA